MALRIGHTTMYQGYCRLSREAKSTDSANLHTIKGVDSRIFYNSGAQMRSDMAKVQLEEYLHNTFPNESHIVCDSTAKKFHSGLGIDQDYVMTCTVGSQQVDFLFQDLTEGRKSHADAGVDAMQCIISGGTFKGESCRGPTKDECTKLDAALRAKGSTEGAKWDDKVRACILGNAKKAYKQEVATNYVVSAVVIVGGTLVVIGTGGLAAPVVAGGVEMLITDLGINYIIDWNHKRLSRQAANRYGSFIDDAAKCKNEQCALEVLEKHYATLSGVMNDLNTDDQATVDETMDYLVALVQTEYVACGKNDKEQIVYAPAAECAMKNSTLRVIDYIDKVSEPVLIIGSVIYNPGFVTTRFMKIKNISKVAKTMNVSYKEAKQLVKASTLDRFAANTVSVVKADPEVSVFNFIDEHSGKTYYLKHAQEKGEITRAQHAYNILDGNTDIVHTVPIVETNQKVLEDFAVKHGLNNSSGNYWFLMEEVPSEETAVSIPQLAQSGQDPLQTIFRGKKITVAEQEEILKAAQKLDDGGIHHGDLHSNMFFMREPDGKLRIDIIDYEPWSAQDAELNTKIVQEMFDYLSEAGVLE